MRLKTLVALTVLGVLGLQGESRAAFTVYTNRALFNAAAGSIETTTFNASSPQILASPATGAFSQPFGNVTLSGNSNGDYIAIAAGTNPGNIDGTNFFYFSQRNPTTGSYDGNGGTGPTFTYSFAVPSVAFGFDYVDTDFSDSYNFTVNGTAFSNPPFVNSGTNGGVGSGFFGIVATGETFSSATFVQTAAGGIVDPFGIDNVSFTTQPIGGILTPAPASIVVFAAIGLSGLATRRLRSGRRAVA